ncbi:MAG: hypothetical protein ACXIUQ_00375 [Cecembia sp.]
MKKISQNQVNWQMYQNSFTALKEIDLLIQDSTALSAKGKPINSQTKFHQCPSQKDLYISFKNPIVYEYPMVDLDLAYIDGMAEGSKKSHFSQLVKGLYTLISKLLIIWKK